MLAMHTNHRATLPGVIRQTVVIGNLLGEFRNATGARWAAIFQFHNGGVFLNQNPQWRLACTYERADAGDPLLGVHFSGMLVSRAMELVQHLFLDSRTVPYVHALGEGLYLLDVIRMEAGFVRSTFEQGGVERLVQGPLHDRHGRVSGFLLTTCAGNSAAHPGSESEEFRHAITRALAASNGALHTPLRHELPAALRSRHSQMQG
jgi:hypothetical protein